MSSTIYPESTHIGLVLPTQRQAEIPSDVRSDPLENVVKHIADHLIDEISTWTILRKTYPELRAISTELSAVRFHCTHKEDELLYCVCRILTLQMQVSENTSRRGG